MANPKVSIIIPVYNGSNYLREAIDSALEQTYHNLEVLVINDGSDDQGKTEDIATFYGDRIRYFFKENGGVASALNLGIHNMSGEYFSWLSHDDVFLPTKIERQVEFLQNFPQFKACYTNFYIIDDRGNLLRKRKVPWYPRQKALRVLFGRQYIDGSTMVIEKSCFDKVGLFTERLRYTQDAEMWLRLLQYFEIGHISEYLGKQRVHSERGSCDLEAHTAETQLMYSAFFKDVKIEIFFPKLAKYAHEPQRIAYAYAWFGHSMALHRNWYTFADRKYQHAIELWPSWGNPARLMRCFNKVLPLYHTAQRCRVKIIHSIMLIVRGVYQSLPMIKVQPPSKKPKLIFTSRQISPGFMTQDMELMKPCADIIPLDLSGGRPTRPVFFSKFFYSLIKDHSQVVISFFFCEEYTWLVAILVWILRRKLIIITGGTDSTYIPDIDFGALNNWQNRFLFRLTMHLTNSVLPFSDSSRSELLKFGKPSRIHTIYMGVDIKKFIPGDIPKKRQAITSTYHISKVSLLQKGIEPFVRAAKFTPGVKFIVNGKISDDTYEYLVSIASPNVLFTKSFLDLPQYIQTLQTSAVYVQASAHEGFGVSLAESMACECVPVIANRYAMPEVVGDTGYIVPFNDPIAIGQAIQNALEHPEKGKAARNRIVENFSLAKRQNALRQELELILGYKLINEQQEK